MKLVLLLAVIFYGLASGQERDPDKILDKVKEKFSTVKDYVVDVEIKVDVEFLKVPNSRATIYFKQPDMIHVESKTFALLPKEGLDFSPTSLLRKEHTAIFEKNVDLNGYKTSVIKVIPLGDQGDVILSTLWVDQKENIIRKVETSTKTGGTFTIEFSYGTGKHPLPSTMVFGFNLEKMNLPSLMTNEPGASAEKKKIQDKNTKGRVYINYSNYRINEGISDSIFEKDKKK